MKKELLGYDNKKCNNCGRMRVERYSNGERICEKCNWNQIDGYDFSHLESI